MVYGLLGGRGASSPRHAKGTLRGLDISSAGAPLLLVHHHVDRGRQHSAVLHSLRSWPVQGPQEPADATELLQLVLRLGRALRDGHRLHPGCCRVGGWLRDPAEADVPVGSLVSLGSPFYVEVKSNKSLFTGFAQVVAASFRNRRLPLPP